MKKVLVICGPTATGKTNLAIHLIKFLSSGENEMVGEIISVDSRQVYRRMDIGTGKDLPVGVKLHYPNPSFKRMGIGYYKISGIRVWGYDLVSPKKDFSVASYLKKVRPIIKDIILRGKMPVLVGGSGLYLKALVNGVDTAFVPRDDNLRRHLSSFSVLSLFEKLAQLDPEKAASLNQSDRKNPRRLIRAIEVAQWRISNFGKKMSLKLPWNEHFEFLFIGLKAPYLLLEERIRKRVVSRMESGFEKEVLSLLNSGVTWNFHSMDTLGYKSLKGYLLKKMTKEKMIEDWIRDEFNYAKRQIVWFKKDKRIKWFDIGEGDWLKKVEKVVKNWYSN